MKNKTPKTSEELEELLELKTKIRKNITSLISLGWVLKKVQIDFGPDEDLSDIEWNYSQLGQTIETLAFDMVVDWDFIANKFLSNREVK